MKLENCISELFYRHDCVIVPDFGAFIAQQNSSSYNEENSSFNPPTKLLSFNPLLATNDGLLIQYFMQKQKLDYVTATEQIKNSVQFWKLQLDKNSSLVLDNLGSFKKQNGTIEFYPIEKNFLLSSYGLDTIKATYILPTEVSKKSNDLWWKAAALIPLIVGGYLYFGKPKPVADFVNEQWSGFVSPWVQPTENLDKQTLVVARKEVQKPTIIEESKISLPQDYQVIAGAFRVKSEALTMEEKLHEKGFERAKLTQKKGSYYYVAFETFSTKDEALDYRETVKVDFPETWVLSMKE